MQHGFKAILAGITLFIIVTASAAPADEIGSRVVGPTGIRMAFFDDSEGKFKAGEWSREEVGAMTLLIQATHGDFVQVKTAAGKAVWLDRDRIRVARKGVECVKVATGSVEQAVAGTRGAAKIGGCL